MFSWEATTFRLRDPNRCQVIVFGAGAFWTGRVDFAVAKPAAEVAAETRAFLELAEIISRPNGY